MVAHILRLKLTLLRNSLSRSTMQLVGLIFAALYGFGALLAVVAGLVGLGTQTPEVISTVIVLAGSALLIGWLVVPVLASGLDMTLDPARFTTYAIPMKSMLLGLGLSSFIGIPGLITLLASMATALAWWSQPLVGLVALLCGVLGAVSCIVASRAITAASASLSSSRKFKDFSGILILVPLIFLGPIFASVGSGIRDFQAYLPTLANTLSWTPLGAVWAVPSDVARGNLGAAALKLLIALGTIGVLVWIWKVCLAKALVTPAHAGGVRREGGKLGFFALFPGTPSGAVAARSLTYWFRDPRYSAGLLIAPLLPLVLAFGLSQAFDGGALGSAVGLGGAISAYLVVWSIAADISYDNTAFALHIAAGVRGKDDRTGRALAAGILALTLGLVYAVVGLILSGNVMLFLATLGLTFGVVGSGLGLASVFSARFTMNVPLPGDNPMKSRPGNNLGAGLLQFGGMAGLALLVLPEIILAVVAFSTGSALISWITLVTGILLGGLFYWLGVRQGSVLYDKRAPELLLAVSAQT